MDVGSNKSRKDTRAVVSLVARYRSPSTFEYVQEACCDVSVGGMFIKSTDPAAAGTLLKLECEADRNADKIRGVARVVWLRRDNNEYGPSGMGVKFVKLEPGSRETITRIVQENSAAGIEPLSMSSAPESRGKPPGVHAVRSKDNGKPSGASAAHTAIAASAPQAAVAPVAPSPVAPPAKVAAISPPPQVAVAVVPAEVSIGFVPDTSSQPGRPSRPEVVAAPPRSAIDTHSVSAVPPEPVAAPPKSGGVRVGWLIAVAIAALVLYLVTKKDTSVPVETSPPAPTPAAEPTGTTASAAPESTKEPAAEAKQAQEVAQPSNPEAPAAQPQAAPAEPPGQEPTKPEATAAAPAAEAKPAEPAAQAPAVAAPEIKPASEVAAAANAAPAAQPAAASATPPAAAPASDRPPLAPGQVPYIMSFVTRPTGASVTIGTQTIVAPGEMDLGAMPPRVRVTAQKEGYESSSVWLDRETEFVRSAGAMRRKVYLTLPALKPAADAPKP